MRGDLYPRYTNAYGSDKKVCGVAMLSELGTCGVLGFSNNINDWFIYLDGTNPMTPKFGGLNEVMNNTAGGITLGPAVPAGFWDVEHMDGITTFGTARVSSSVVVVANGSQRPACGLMCNNGHDIRYLFVTSTGELRLGTEVDWLAATPGGTVLATMPGSGLRGERIAGRTLIGNSRSNPFVTLSTGVMVVASAGLAGGAIVLASGDHARAVAMFSDSPTTVKFVLATDWLFGNIAPDPPVGEDDEVEEPPPVDGP